MITLKQLEAFNWIAKLGTFERAAAKLNTTQSAISKRIQELEASIGLPLLDRSHRGARLARHRSEEHTSELQSLMRISYAVFCLNKKNINTQQIVCNHTR